MKQILYNLFIGFLIVMTNKAFGLEITDLKWWSVALVLAYCNYILTYDSDSSSKRN